MQKEQLIETEPLRKLGELPVSNYIPDNLIKEKLTEKEITTLIKAGILKPVFIRNKFDGKWKTNYKILL